MSRMKQPLKIEVRFNLEINIVSIVRFIVSPGQPENMGSLYYY
jgi:hypothetical protein